MRLPQFITTWLARRYSLPITRGLPVYCHLGPPDNRYMLRWWVFGAKSQCRNTERPGGPEPGGSWLYEKLSEVFCLRLHHIVRSDKDRALHDHPCASVSVVLEGGYWEILPYQPKDDLDAADYHKQLGILTHLRPGRKFWLEDLGIMWRAPGDVVFRRATDAHRIVIPFGRPSVSLFAMFAKTNSWGFYPDIERGEMRKVPWREYLGIK